MAIRKGYEGQVYIGTAGSKATTLISNKIDLDYNVGSSLAETTVSGAGTSVPIETQVPVGIKPEVKFSVRFDSTDTAVATLLARSVDKTSLAIATADYASGKGFDGDCTIDMTGSYKLKDATVYEFTCTPAAAPRALYA